MIITLSKFIGMFFRIKPLGVNENGLEVFLDRKKRKKMIKLNLHDAEILSDYINNIVCDFPTGHGLILKDEIYGFYYIEEEVYYKSTEEMFKQKVLHIQNEEVV